MAEGAARAGAFLACRPGCTECCHGPFPINRLDARRLGEGLHQLAESAPERASSVVTRARAQLATLEEGFPGDPRSGELGEDEDLAEAYFARHGALPCPALDPETGRCDLYAFRPLSCRTFGLPIRLGETDLPPCRLCFIGATCQEIEACRVEPDPNGLEDRLLDGLGGLGEGETLIAFVLARPR
ncbi:MAG TPA: YkgJ family cysteine cluster protein [Thermoanaerobaculia bacterium]|nr:YkgJ family cysteine cluster protein [Thermoanaerobaculia bacterium]